MISITTKTFRRSINTLKYYASFKKYDHTDALNFKSLLT